MVWPLAQYQRHCGVNTSIGAVEDAYSAEDSARYDDVPHFIGRVVGPKKIGFSPALRKHVLSISDDIDVIHSHGIWTYTSRLGRIVAGKKRIPMVISPHGMLAPWSLNNARFKKRVARLLYENRNLRSAACLHASSHEYRTLRDLGLNNPIAMLPNGVDPDVLEALPAYETIEKKFPALAGRRRVLFLSRIHPKKGLEPLLRAWANVSSSFPQWMLVVTGTNELGHESAMKNLSEHLRTKESVCFTGPLYGTEKREALAGADVFALPSHSEGFSMIIAEAAASGLPVLLTKDCNFMQLVEVGGAIDVCPNVTDTERGLRTLLGMSQSERQEMGERARRLIVSRFTWPQIAEEMVKVYRWLVGKETKPDFVALE